MFKNFNIDKLKNGLSKTKKKLFEGITEENSKITFVYKG